MNFKNYEAYHFFVVFVTDDEEAGTESFLVIELLDVIVTLRRLAALSDTVRGEDVDLLLITAAVLIWLTELARVDSGFGLSFEADGLSLLMTGCLIVLGFVDGLVSFLPALDKLDKRLESSPPFRFSLFSFDSVVLEFETPYFF